MTEGHYKLPEGWRWVKLEEVASDIQSGFAFRKKGAEMGEILHVRPYNIGNDGELKLDQQFRIPSTALPEHWSYLYPGDVLFNNTNSVELVGKTALVRTELQAAFSNHITRIRVHLNQCKGEWIALALGALWQQGFFAQRCNKWIGQAGYNTEMLRKTPIPLPPLEEQRRIVARIEELMERIREARHLRQKAREDTERLWQATLFDVFPRPGMALPPGWRWVKLGEVAKIYSGSPAPQNSEYFRDGHQPFVRVSDLSSANDNQISRTKDYLNDKAKSLRLKKAPKGTIVFPKSGAAILTNARAILEVDAFIVSHLAAIEVDGSLVDRLWVFRWLQTVDMGQQIENPSYPSLRLSKIKQLVLPLPPLEEQRRIVARIEELMERIREARHLRQKAREDTERIWQATLFDVFPRPGMALPSGWRWVKLGEVFKFQQGASMSPKRRQGRNPKPFLRTRNILWGKVDISSVDEMDFTEEEIEKLRLQIGDLLVCEGGDVGKTAIWEEQLPLVLYQNHIHRLRAKDDSVEPRFFIYWMQVAYKVFQQYQGIESRTAIPNLSGQRLKQFVAPLPPLEEQRRIVAHLEEVEEKVKSLKEGQAQVEAELQRLEQSILNAAFRGEL